MPEHDLKARPDFQRLMLANDFVLVGDPLLTVSIASPIRAEYVAAYSYNEVGLAFEGVFEWYHSQYKANLVYFSESTDASSSSEMGLNNLAGPFLIFGILVVMAIVFYAREDVAVAAAQLARRASSEGRGKGSIRDSRRSDRGRPSERSSSTVQVSPEPLTQGSGSHHLGHWASGQANVGVNA